MTNLKQSLQLILDRADAATPNPWHERVRTFLETDEHIAIGPTHKTGPFAEVQAFMDARFIANARTDVPKLAKLLQAAIETVEDMKRHSEQYNFDYNFINFTKYRIEEFLKLCEKELK